MGGGGECDAEAGSGDVNVRVVRIDYTKTVDPETVVRLLCASVRGSLLFPLFSRIDHIYVLFAVCSWTSRRFGKCT